MFFRTLSLYNPNIPAHTQATVGEARRKSFVSPLWRPWALPALTFCRCVCTLSNLYTDIRTCTLSNMYTDTIKYVNRFSYVSHIIIGLFSYYSHTTLICVHYQICIQALSNMYTDSPTFLILSSDYSPTILILLSYDFPTSDGTTAANICNRRQWASSMIWEWYDDVLLYESNIILFPYVRWHYSSEHL